MKITENFEYMNKIANNVKAINQNQFARFFNELKPPEDASKPDLWLYSGEGRTECSLAITLNETGKSVNRIRVRDVNDVGLPGSTVYEAAPELERDYNNIKVILASGSGESTGPLTTVRETAKYLEDKKNDRWKIFLSTSRPKSKIAKIVKENDGIILEIKGAKKKSKEFLKTGIMRDQFELANLFVFQGVGQMVYERAEPDRFPEIVKERFTTIGKMIDEHIKTGSYETLMDNLERHCNVFCGGKDGGYYTSKMNAIRLRHIKNLMGDEVFLIKEPSVKKPLPGDPLIITSFSGGKEGVYPGGTKEEDAYVFKLAQKYQGKKAIVYAFVGNENSPLGREADHTALLKMDVKHEKPNPFYLYAAFVQSPLPGVLAKRLSYLGYPVSPEIVEWYHSL